MSRVLSLKSGVIYEVHPAIVAAENFIARAYGRYVVVPIVTSAHDGHHSHNSAHKQADPAAVAKAIDLRIWSLFRHLEVESPAWWREICCFAGELATDLLAVPVPGRFDVVVEKDHLHLEYSDAVSLPNILGWDPAHRVHFSRDVRERIV